MLRYAGRRVLGAIPLVLGVATILFFVLHLAPGDPVYQLVGPGTRVDAATLDQLRERYGLDDPLPVQYVRWLADLAQGDLGESIHYNRPVRAVIAETLPNTLILASAALLLAFLAGLLIGVIQAVRQYSLLDSSLSVVSLFFYSMPSFWLAIMLVLVFAEFAVLWDWPISFPASGTFDDTSYPFLSPWGRLLDRLHHLVLPAVSLALVLAAGIARYTRGSMLEVIRQDYVRTARAKGLPERTVIFKHALRNGLLPVITIFGLYLPFLFSGAVLIESVFAWPGMGRLVVDAIQQRDYSLVMGGGFIFAVIVVVGNLIADLLYAVVDPRIRYE